MHTDSGYKNKIGKDLPVWWTKFDWRNFYKRENAAWGNHITEVRCALVCVYVCMYMYIYMYVYVHKYILVD